MQVQWTPELLRVRTATGETGTPGETGKPTEGDDEGAETGAEAGEKAGAGEEKDTRSYLRGLEVPRHVASDKPLLVYFHWPHEDGRRGKDIRKFCSGPLDDEVFVRFAALFHCVEVNTKDSDERVVREAKVDRTPTLMICRPDFEIVWRSDDARLSGKGLVSVLRKVLASSFEEKWTEVEKTVEEQKKTLKEAQVHVAKKEWTEAEGLLYSVVDSDVRFERTWPEARKMLKGVQAEVLKEREERDR